MCAGMGFEEGRGKGKVKKSDDCRYRDYRLEMLSLPLRSYVSGWYGTNQSIAFRSGVKIGDDTDSLLSEGMEEFG